MAAWHLPGGPVGPPARWAATSNVEEGVERRRELRGPELGKGSTCIQIICSLGIRVSRGRFEDPVRVWLLL